jgi:hypothetical protein
MEGGGWGGGSYASSTVEWVDKLILGRNFDD